MEIFDVSGINGIENCPAAGEIFLESVILKVSQTLFLGFLPQGRGIHFSRVRQCPPRGVMKYPGYSGVV